MLLKKIKIVQYKNIKNIEFSPHPAINAFTGLNGMGKTNILDAIHYLCLAKSNFGRLEKNNVMQGEEFFRIEGEFEKEDKKYEIVAKVKPPRTKIIENNSKALNKISDHIGNFPVVIIAPRDKNALLENSRDRRKLMDRALSQTDKKYLKALLDYNKWLKQRNALLKNSPDGNIDRLLLDTFDKKLNPLARFIFIKREEFIKKLLPEFLDIYKNISGGKEIPDIKYSSQLENKEYSLLVVENMKKDIILKRSNSGIHKDDLIFKVNNEDLRTFASQGQLKSFALAIKLAEFSFLKKEKGYIPIVILDDVFDKLDKNRVKHLVSLLFENNFGQVFISDTERDRVEQIFERSSVSYKIFEIEKGNIINEYAS